MRNSGSPCQPVGTADAIFTGEVSRITTMQPAKQADGSMSWPQLRISFSLARRLTGVPEGEKEIEVLTGSGGGDCGYPFRLGESYMVYANKGESGSLSAGICSRTTPPARAAEDLAYFDSLGNAKPVVRIYGSAFGHIPGECRAHRLLTRWPSP